MIEARRAELERWKRLCYDVESLGFASLRAASN